MIDDDLDTFKNKQFEATGGTASGVDIQGELADIKKNYVDDEEPYGQEYEE